MDRFSPGQMVRLVRDHGRKYSRYVGEVTHILEPRKWLKYVGDEKPHFAYTIALLGDLGEPIAAEEDELEPVEGDDSRQVTEWDEIFDPRVIA